VALIGFEPFQFVLFEPVRSAEPPSISGIFAHRTFSTCCDDERVAIAELHAAANDYERIVRALHAR
jgi:hypothetical protein